MHVGLFKVFFHALLQVFALCCECVSCFFCPLILSFHLVVPLIHQELLHIHLTAHQAHLHMALYQMLLLRILLLLVLIHLSYMEHKLVR